MLLKIMKIQINVLQCTLRTFALLAPMRPACFRHNPNKLLNLLQCTSIRQLNQLQQAQKLQMTWQLWPVWKFNQIEPLMGGKAEAQKASVKRFFTTISQHGASRRTHMPFN